jgi:hypothetical protein
MVPGAEAGPGATPPRIESPAISKTGELPADWVPPATVGLPEELYAERAAIVVALKAEGYTNKEITATTGLSLWQIRYACRQARKRGDLQDVISDLSHRALPQAVENLVDALEDPENVNHWKATEETLHGLGAFKSHKNNVNEGSGATAPLQIAFVMQGGGDVPTVIVNSTRGEIGGTPRQDVE